MKDLQKPGLMYLKAVLLAAISLVCCVLILLDAPRWYVAGLLALAIWSASRVYYFMFYVIEKYVDPSYKFAGITSFLGYLVRQRGRGGETSQERDPPN